MLGHPGIIHRGAGSVERAVLVHGVGLLPVLGIGPFMDFGMAIGKTENAGAVVGRAGAVTGARYIDKRARVERHVWILIEVHVVDAVRVFAIEDEGQRWSRIDQITHCHHFFAKLGKIFLPLAHGCIQGVAADTLLPTCPYLLGAEKNVGGTFVNLVIGDVRSHLGPLWVDEQSKVGVVRVGPGPVHDPLTITRGLTVVITRIIIIIVIVSQTVFIVLSVTNPSYGELAGVAQALGCLGLGFCLG